MKNKIALLVFTKVPELEKVKTRLIPALGAHGAVSLHKKLVEETLSKFIGIQNYDLYIWIAGDLTNAWVKTLNKSFSTVIKPQIEGDLGQKLCHATETAFKAYEQVILIGTDCPPLTPKHIQDATEAHSKGIDVVIVPVEDGGYALISMKAFSEKLFEGISWSSEHVLSQTLGQIKKLGWTYQLLETLWDLDRPSDLRRYLAEDRRVLLSSLEKMD